MSIFDIFTHILNTVLNWCTQITSFIVNDTLIQFSVGLIVLSYVVKFFNKMRHLK